jgi:hypothetical protein
VVGRVELTALVDIATDSRQLECREALAFPGDPDRVVLIRRVEARRGDARVHVLLDCRAGFCSTPMDLRPDVTHRLRQMSVPGS